MSVMLVLERQAVISFCSARRHRSAAFSTNGFLLRAISRTMFVSMSTFTGFPFYGRAALGLPVSKLRPLDNADPLVNGALPISHLLKVYRVVLRRFLRI